ncbi:MAG TPA: sulfatase-like hydrolase/transferase [Pseudomonadales bacterium]|nr:sulfatase-like hydrolase/transferase [Pseudomonadales bacterium]
MKKFALAIVVLSGIVAIGYHYRLELMLSAAPRIDDLRAPIDSNREVVWSQGPDTATAPPAERPPNVVVIVADDMGFNDVSFYNGGAADGSLQTPHIDSIGRDGVAFSNGYAANAVCAPSRASIMTGRYSTRFGFEFTPFFKIGVSIFEAMAERDPSPLKLIVHRKEADAMKPLEENGMPPSEITVAEVLKTAGYQTAHIGKWHLGGIGDMRPEKQGFDDSLYLSGISYLPADSPNVENATQDFDPIDRMVWASMRYSTQFNGGHPFAPKGYLTDYYTDEAVKVIEANRNQPFFLYLAHWGIHNPLQAKKEDYDALSHIQDHRMRVYAAMITALDRGVGRVLDALRTNGLADNTLVIFTSDNGGAGYLGLPDINKPYRGWKLTLFEGGTHVPFFARWPGHIAPGTHYDMPVGHVDILPTVAAAAGATLSADPAHAIDGVDVLPFVRGERTGAPHETLFWREGYHQAVLHDGWKLIESRRPDRKWLFHLTENPTEHEDVAAANPKVVAQLQALLDAHNAEQAPPMWPSVIESPQLIDKTGAQPYVEGDDYTYWPN